MIRSAFWQAEPYYADSQGLGALLSRARFLAVATANSNGDADLSPKGDPAGLTIKQVNGEVCFAERPGNRRTDSLLNMLQRPYFAMLVIAPGSNSLATISGTAIISTDRELRAKFEVDGKLPKLVTKVSNPDVQIKHSDTLEQLKLWPPGAPPDGVDPAEMFAAHIRLNKKRGIGARVTKSLVSVPGLLTRSLKSDYKKNLY